MSAEQSARSASSESFHGDLLSVRGLMGVTLANLTPLKVTAMVRYVAALLVARCVAELFESVSGDALGGADGRDGSPGEPFDEPNQPGDVDE